LKVPFSRLKSTIAIIIFYNTGNIWRIFWMGRLWGAFVYKNNRNADSTGRSMGQTAVFPNPSKNPQISLMAQICNLVAVKICVNLRYLRISYL